MACTPPARHAEPVIVLVVLAVWAGLAVLTGLLFAALVRGGQQVHETAPLSRACVPSQRLALDEAARAHADL